MSDNDTAPKKPVKPHSPRPGTVFDVKRPGKAPLQPTSRPVIVGHKPMVRDPLTTGKVESDRLLQKKPKLDITPLASPESKPASTGAAATPELAAIAAELSTSPKPPTPLMPPAKLDNAPPTSDKSNTSEPEPEWIKAEETPAGKEEQPKDYIPGSTAPVIPPEPVKKQVPLSPELKAKMEAEVRNNPTVSEPHGIVVAGEHGPINFSKVFLWFLSVILLVVVVGDMLLDAKVITTSVNIPHTHFIKK